MSATNKTTVTQIKLSFIKTYKIIWNVDSGIVDNSIRKGGCTCMLL